MLDLKHSWSHDGTSGGLTPVPAEDGVLESVLYVQTSTIATTNSFVFQTGFSSTGPWASENSTSISADGSGGSLDRIRVTGPYPWMRPYFPTKSTGTYTIKLVGVS